MFVVLNAMLEVQNEMRSSRDRMTRIWGECESAIDGHMMNEPVCRAALIAALRESTTELDGLKAAMARQLKNLGEQAPS